MPGLLMSLSLRFSRGQYRKVQNCVVSGAIGQTVYTPPPADDVPPLMAEMVMWLNSPGDGHPVLVSGVTPFQFVHIHPFMDGNGRTSHLLSTLRLYRAGYRIRKTCRRVCGDWVHIFPKSFAGPDHAA